MWLYHILAFYYNVSKNKWPNIIVSILECGKYTHLLGRGRKKEKRKFESRKERKRERERKKKNERKKEKKRKGKKAFLALEF